MTTILAGTAFGQLLAVVASPLISRLYTPEDFGTFSIVSAIAMTFGTFMALRFEMAIPLPEHDHDAKSLVHLAGLTCIVTTLLGTLLIALTLGPISSLFQGLESPYWILATPTIASLFAIFRVLNQWALRHSRFTAAGVRNALNGLTATCTQVALGLRGAGPSGLVAGLALGQVVGALSLVYGARIRGRMDRRLMLSNLHRYRRFPLMLAPAGILNAAGMYMPLLLVAMLYGVTAAGWLGFTQRVMSIPMMLLGQAVAQVYLSQLAVSRRESTNDELNLFRVATRRLAVLGTSAALALLAFGPTAFNFVFGDAWIESGLMAQALALSLAAQFVASPLSQTLIVFERLGLQFVWDALRAASASASVILSHAFGATIIECVWILSLTLTAAYAISWQMSRKALNRELAIPRSVQP